MLRYVLLSILLSLVIGKSTVHYINSINPNDPFHLQDVFAFDALGPDSPGILKYSTTGSAQDLEITVYNDEESSWHELQRRISRGNITCEEKVKLAKVSIPLLRSTIREEQAFFTAHARPYFWYIVLTGCNRKYNTSNLNLEIKFQYLNPGGFFQRHFSKEEQSILEQHLVFIPLFSVTGVFYIYVLYKFLRSNSFHFIVLFYASCCITYYIGLWLNIIHLFVYAANGVGVKAFGILGEVFKGASEILLVLLLLLLASGWTITYQFMRNKIAMIVIALVHLVLSMVLFIWSQVGIPIGSIHYIYSTWPGVILSLFRFPLLGYFLYLGITSAKNEDDSKKKRFYIIFMSIYSFWFVILPIVVFTLLILPWVWWRLRVIEWLMMILDFTAISGLIILLWPSSSLQYFNFTKEINEEENSITTSSIYQL